MRTKSRRIAKLSPTPVIHNLIDVKQESIEEDDNGTRVYRTPKMGWNSRVRRVVQYGFIKLGMPSEFNEFGNNQWRGPHGLIKKLQDYADISGWRSKKIVREIIRKCSERGKAFDAGRREKMGAPRGH